MGIFHKKEKKLTEREKVEERREEVLSKGRKFKYPLQYAKHAIVAITIALSVLVILGFGAAGYVALYKFKATDDVLYRITQILPVAVANVDGERVRYSDYLLIYRSSITPVEAQQGKFGGDTNSETMREYYKRAALTDAEDYTYAMKLAKELGVTVSNDEINSTIDSHRKAGGVERSMDTFARVLEENFGVSLDEYKRLIYLSLVKQKVSEEIDSGAKAVASSVESLISEGKSLKDISDQLGSQVLYEETAGMVDSMNIDGGRAEKAMSLEVGKISDKFISSSGDGYYFVSTLQKNENSVAYASIEVPFTEFNNKLKQIRDNGKIKEKITFDEKADDANGEQNS